jgi:hypothetical protein
MSLGRPTIDERVRAALFKVRGHCEPCAAHWGSALHSHGGTNCPLHIPALRRSANSSAGTYLRAVAVEGERPSEASHPSRQVLTVGPAHRDYAAVAIPVLRLARDHALADPVIERLRRLLSAAVGRALRIHASLPTLRRSMPNRRMRWSLISIVSPSMTLARPMMGPGRSRARLPDATAEMMKTEMMRRIIR